ncbi:GNAT family N-acetyltransferase [Pseudomonas sp. A46]|nr:GNAT family N-acetyltransferase [Pseudomonas sp. A46]OWJ89962.1 GNAT family N-acetyltransferase [Pseudomonas sp. A46]
MPPVSLPTLLTPRLILYPLTLADADAIQRHFPHWEVVRFLAEQVPWPYPPDGARTFLEQVALPAMQRGVQWHWSIRERAEPDQLIGVVSLMDDERDNHRGFWLGVPWHGRGYMTEASEAVTDYWFGTLGKPLLRAPKAVANTASRRISERSGMRLLRTEERGYVSGRHLSEIWEITREEWLARQGLS